MGISHVMERVQEHGHIKIFYMEDEYHEKKV